MYLIKHDGQTHTGDIEGLWYSDIVQSALTWRDPDDIGEFQAMLDAGKVLKLGGGNVKVWKYERPEQKRADQ